MVWVRLDLNGAARQPPSSYADAATHRTSRKTYSGRDIAVSIPKDATVIDGIAYWHEPFGRLRPAGNRRTMNDCRNLTGNTPERKGENVAGALDDSVSRKINFVDRQVTDLIVDQKITG